MERLEFCERYGPWAIVTGASDGIGQACAHALAARGLHLVLVGRREDKLRTLARQLTHHQGVHTQVVVADLATDTGLQALLDDTATLDVGLLVAAAGYGSAGAFLDQRLDTELDMLTLNCRSVLAQCWHLGQRFKARGRGGMVLFGSLLGFHGTPGSANYAATKAYVQSLAEALRVEWHAHGIDVLACAPGPVHTGFAERAGMRMGLAARPDEVAQATLAALGRTGTVRPGVLSKLLGWSLGTAPRALRVRLMGQIMQGMTHTARSS